MYLYIGPVVFIVFIIYFMSFGLKTHFKINITLSQGTQFEESHAFMSHDCMESL